MTLSIHCRTRTRPPAPRIGQVRQGVSAPPTAFGLAHLLGARVKMPITRGASEIVKVPDTPIRPPRTIADVRQLNRRHQYPPVIRPSALLNGLVQARYVALAHLLVKDSGGHLDHDDAGDGLSVHVLATAQPVHSLNLFDEHPAQATLPWIVAYAFMSDGSFADTLQQAFTLQLAESAGRHLYQDVGHD